MEKYDSIFVVTHVNCRNFPPYDPIEGPFSSVCKVLIPKVKKLETCQMPLFGFKNPIFYGKWNNDWRKQKKLKIFKFLGSLTSVKYLLDILIITFFLFRFNFLTKSRKKLVIGVDPLSCLPLVFFKKLFQYKLIFYSVDFNKNRFQNKLLQYFYEKADEISSKLSDQIWVVCESLKDYKEKHYNVKSIYIPNSQIFSIEPYRKSRKFKSGNKVAWTGTCITQRQFFLLSFFCSCL